MMTSRKFVVTARFDEIPKQDDFVLVSDIVSSLKEGEALLKTQWVSVDPYVATFNKRLTPPYDQFGFQIGSVIKTRNQDFAMGDYVVNHNGWCDYSIIGQESKNKFLSHIVYTMSPMRQLSASNALGVVGMPGVSAYIGLLHYCRPKAGETVVVSGADGAVGAIAGQIAKIKNCNVIGITSTEKKAEWLLNDLGFDDVILYNERHIREKLDNVAPKGIDCYFDCVGGNISTEIIPKMNKYGRVTICSNISGENEMTMPKRRIYEPAYIFKKISFKTFFVTDWLNYWPIAIPNLIKWVMSGEIIAKEKWYVGLERLPTALGDLMIGNVVGKPVVQMW